MPTELPFQFRVCRANEDLRLITTDNLPVILHLIEVFGLEEEIANNVSILLDRAVPAAATSIISLRSLPEKGDNFAYTALLECDLCGVTGGFFAVFKSYSGDDAALTEECATMHDFINKELQNAQSLREFKFPSEESFSL